MKRRILACVLALALGISVAGCEKSEALKLSATDMMEEIRPRCVSEEVDVTDYGADVTDFGLRLVQNSMEPGENLLISPLSVLSALSMTANGADEETLSQMETVLGMTTAELNLFFHSYLEALEEKENGVLSMANSIWFKDDPKLQVEESFLQTNGDYFGADIYRAAFDKNTCQDINTWVTDRTDGMIEEILDQIPEEAIMYLVNALAFDAEWQKTYTEYQVRDAIFTTEDGAEQKVELMWSSENLYLSDESATGFLKPYKGGDYAFVALLPNEGISVSDYIKGLTGEKLYSMLSGAEYTSVDCALPKFKTECDYEMSEILIEMGMTDAFDWQVSDFSRLGSYEDLNICIGRVLHKTFISVADMGTKAGAATVVEVAAEGAALEIKEVRLDRPFVYMLVDCDTNIPLFIGTMLDAD